MNKWGTINLTKFAIIREAPLTASGYNEIVVTTCTKKEAIEILKKSYTDSGYTVERLKETANG